MANRLCDRVDREEQVRTCGRDHFCFRDWIGSPDRLVFLLPLTVFTILRLIPDHFPTPGSLVTSVPMTDTNILNLRQRELTLVDELIRKHFDRCAQIGRDFVRLLHGVARLDPIKTLWNDILTNISSLTSYYTDISEILEITTPQYFTQTVIPHEMEQWARWMMKNVHCIPRVPVNRYQDFFQRKFFSTPESQSLRVNLLRYIVTFFYPDNEMLASTLIPRWNVISWILSQSTCPVVTANAKLALFYDWLFFKPNDCIMNLEPALLAIMNHLTPRSQPIALSLTDFLVKIAASYYPPLTDRIITGVRTGLEEMIRLGVVKNINPLFEMLHRTSPDLFRSLRMLLGCEPLIPPVLSSANPLEAGSVAGTLASVGVILNTAGKTDVKNDAPQTNALSVGPLGPSVVRRPSTPPLASGKPKPSGTTEAGALMDPRLTRGHAAIRAGVVSPGLPVPVTQPDIIVPKPVTEAATINSSQANTVSSPTLPCVQQPPPALTNMDGSTMPDEISVRGGVKRTSLTLPVAPRTICETTTAEPPLLSEDDLDQLEIDKVEQNESTLSRASWSPPPLPPSQSSFIPRQDQLPETPESTEMTIGKYNLRRRFQEYQLWYHYSVKPVDVNALIEQLDGPIRTALENFRDLALKVGLVRNTGTMVCADRATPRDPDPDVINGCVDQQRLSSVRLRSALVLRELCDSMEAFVQAILDEDCFDDLVIAARIGSVICELLYPLFAERLIASRSRNGPKSTKLNDEKMVTYRNFCASQENPCLRKSLLKDMQLLADDNRRLFAYLLPDVFTVFSSELTNDAEFMRLVVGALDPVMLNTLICEIVRGHLNLFRSNDLSPVLQASLQWDSIEQMFFWQLVNAHEIPTRRFLPLVRCIDPAIHPEACANLIQLFKLEKPNYELVRALLSRPKPDDPLSVTALHFWSCPDNHGSLFAEILSEMITVPLTFRSDSSSGPAREGRDRRRNGAKNQVTPENAVDLSLILTHLDSIRRNCKNMSNPRTKRGAANRRCSLLQDVDIQNALQSVANSRDVPVSIKDHFSDLLALAEDQPTPPPVGVGGSTRTASSGAQSSGTGNRLNGNTGSTTEVNSRRGGRGAALGSKGGHSLRNLDSRRAAEAERRQTPNATNKRSSRAGTSSAENARTSAEADSDAEEAEAISLLSSSASVSSASSENDDDSESADAGATTRSGSTAQKKRRSRNSSPVRGGGSTAKVGKRTSANTVDTKERRSAASIIGGKRSSEKTEREPSSPKIVILDDSLNDDEEDDDDEDKNLEVVVPEDDSGDEHNIDRVRPPKRRKTSTRRFNLDD
ncbi:SOSS complex subunit A [Fasciola gigantica]|uniref:SOSS complex subunit A n=1 Tax=Fasciola gigantica TaxID=46835 RepID=A0A504YW20_FASGI|nr:SOSS complex subunit A [Fasciola gigantica]